MRGLSRHICGQPMNQTETIKSSQKPQINTNIHIDAYRAHVQGFYKKTVRFYRNDLVLK